MKHPDRTNTYSRSNYIKQLSLVWIRTHRPDVHKKLIQLAFEKFPSKRVRKDDKLIDVVKEIR